MKSKVAQTSKANELLQVDLEIGHQDSNFNNGHQGAIPSCYLRFTLRVCFLL